MLTVSEAMPVLGVMALAGLLVHEAVFMARHLAKCPPDRCTCPLSHRFLAGRTFHGHVVTDATYWRRANNDLTRAKNVGPFQKLPGWKRRLYRTGPVLAAAGLMINLALTVAVLAALVACLVVRRSGRARRMLRRALAWAPKMLRTKRVQRLWVRLPWWLRTPRHRGRVQTMGMLLATITGTVASAVEAGVTWNPDYATAKPGDEVARWVLPRGFKATGGEKSQAQDVWQSRVGFELVFNWRLADDEPAVVMTRAYELPGIVYLHEVLERVDALPETKTAIGLDDQGELVCWDWGTENPHGLLNAGSRHGKTETEEGMVCQVLRKGGKTTYVDVKRVSIQGLKGLPGLTLCDNPRDMVGIWLAIQAWGDDLDERIDQRTKDPTREFCRDLLVLEEVNQFSEMCDEFWENWPEEDEEWRDTVLWKPKRAKRTPPIWRVVKKGVWEGAFCKKNVLIAGQNIEAATIRGIRNSVGMRLLGGYQPQNWKALVGTTPVPPAPPQKGRWCMINGSTQTWVQALIADLDANKSAAIWRDYARADRRMDGTVPVTQGVTRPFTVTGNGTVVAGQAVNTLAHTGPVTGSDPRGVLVGLAEAVRDGYAPGATIQALRMDRHRSDNGELPDGLTFPEPAGSDGQKELFWSGEIAEFNEARRGRKVA